MTPLFSVVIPTYGRPEFLEDAIRSVLAQTIADFECIVVDDASPIPSRVPNDSRIRLVRRPENGGPPAARNTGIAEACGRYVAFLDDDDVWTEDRLAAAVEAHERAPVGVCWQATLGRSQFEPSGRVLEGDVSDTVLDGIIPHLGTTSVERAIAPVFDTRYEASDDVEWWLRLSQSHRVATTRRVGLLYRYHDSPRSRTGAERRLQNAAMLFAEYDEWFRTHPRAKAFRLKRMGLSALSVNERGLALRCFASSMRLHPEPRTAWHAMRAMGSRRGATKAAARV